MTVPQGVVSVGGLTTVEAGGTLTLNGGTLNANNGLTLSTVNLTPFPGAAVDIVGGALAVGGVTIVNDGATLTLNGGTLDADGDITVLGGTVNVTTGGTFHAKGGLTITGGSGVVTIENDASLILDATLFVARDSTNATTNATVNIRTGGEVSTADILIGDLDGNEGVGALNLDGVGSTLTQVGASSLTLGNADTPGSGGVHTISIANNAIFTTGAGAVTINKTGTLKVAGGDFTANGPVSFNGGTLHKVIADYDQPIITTTAGLTIGAGSTLKIELAGGFTPVLNDAFPLLNSANTINDTFDNIEGHVIGNGLVFELSTFDDFMELRVVPALIGDTDYDGDVDDFDLLAAIANHTGSLDPGVGGRVWEQGDTDQDGDVDDFDLLTMISGFTGSLPPASPSVPEPGSAALLLAAGFCFIRRRRL